MSTAQNTKSTWLGDRARSRDASPTTSFAAAAGTGVGSVQRPATASAYDLPADCRARRDGRHLEPRMIREQGDEPLADHAGRTEDTDLELVCHCTCNLQIGTDHAPDAVARWSARRRSPQFMATASSRRGRSRRARSVCFGDGVPLPGGRRLRRHLRARPAQRGPWSRRELFWDLVDQTRWFNHSCDPNTEVRSKWDAERQDLSSRGGSRCATSRRRGDHVRLRVRRRRRRAVRVRSTLAAA